MAGNALYQQLVKNRRLNVFGTCKSKSGSSNIFAFDPTKHKLSRLFKIKPDVIINCIGITKQKQNKLSQLYLINSLFPISLRFECEKKKIRLIHLSTDCVFDGQKGNYNEKSKPNAQDDYGISKIIGECDSLNCMKSLTIRTSIIGHELGSNKSLLEWFIKKKKVFGYKKAFFNGITVNELAIIIEKKLLSSKIIGLIHIGSFKISKYMLLKKINEIYKLNVKLIPNNEIKINRTLNCDNFFKISGYPRPSWSKMIKFMWKNYN